MNTNITELARFARSLNRHHPESTVIKTYRLTEWASFLELSGQLSNDDANTEVEMEYDTNHSPRVSQLTDSMIPLTGEQMDYVTQYYLAEISDFRVLTDQKNPKQKSTKNFQVCQNGIVICQFPTANVKCITVHQVMERK